MKLIIDIEANNLNADLLWLIVCSDVDTEEEFVFEFPTGVASEAQVASVLSLFGQSTQLIGHNIVGFDFPMLRKHFPGLEEPAEGLLDTLVVSRMLNYAMDDGHSLEAWGKRLKLEKGEFNDFSRYTPEMLRYCRQDVAITRRLYEFFRRFHSSPQWKEAIANEHNAARIAYDLHVTGFGFNAGRAGELREELSWLLETLDREIREDFPPQTRLIREVTPRETKFGTLNASDFRWLRPRQGDEQVRGSGLDLSSFSPGASFSLFEWVAFNPASPKQMVERLNAAGWKPYEKTKTHIQEERKRPQDKQRLAHFREYGWKVSEDNLNTLPPDAPAGARKLAQRLTLASRLSDLDEWLAQYNPETAAIHGSFLPIGSWTHRMAHLRPNTGNIASTLDAKALIKAKGFLSAVEEIKDKYDGQLRGLWRVRHPGNWQIGVDMESAHLRILAHLIDEPAFTTGMISGKKEDGTDPHTMNMKALGKVCASRDIAKTFIYSFLNGAASPKIANILGCSIPEAKVALEQYRRAYPGLKRLLEEDIPRNAKRGYFVGIDGRLVPYGEEHGQLSGILQNAEAIILKRAAYEGRRKLRGDGIPVQLINLVHDEIQSELLVDDRELALHVGSVFANEYKLAAEHYGLKCPFAGGIAVGKNWYECH